MKTISWSVIATLICSMFLLFSCQKQKEKALTNVQIDSLSMEIVYLSTQNIDCAPRFISECIAKGANPNAVDTNGTPAIVHASLRVDEPLRLELTKLLIEHGVDINAANRQGETALKHFCMRSDTACLDFALANNVDVTVVDSFGYTPLLLLTMQVSAYNDYTGGKGSKKHRRLFYDTDLALIVSEDYNLPYIKEFLKRGADPHHKSKDGESAYSIAKEYDLNLIREAIEQHLQKDNKQ